MEPEFLKSDSIKVIRIAFMNQSACILLPPAGDWSTQCTYSFGGKTTIKMTGGGGGGLG